MTSDSASPHARLSEAAPTAQVISLGELQADSSAKSSRLLARTNPLHAVRARLHVCVGEVELTIGQLLAAKEHEVMVLDRDVDQPVDMVLEGKVVARGQLVAVDGKFALRITELPVPMQP